MGIAGHREQGRPPAFKPSSADQRSGRQLSAATFSASGYIWDSTPTVPMDWHYPPYYRAGVAEKWLLPVAPGTLEFREARLSDYQGIHREFAELDRYQHGAGKGNHPAVEPFIAGPSFEREALNFAQEHGFLSDLMSGPLTDNGWAEPLALWRAEAFTVAKLLWFLDLVRRYKVDADSLNRLVPIDRSEALFIYHRQRPPSAISEAANLGYPGGAPLANIGIAAFQEGWGELTGDYDRVTPSIPSTAVEEAAYRAIAGELNRKLIEHSMVGQVVQRPATSRYEIRLQSPSVLGAIYAQIAHEFTGGPTPKACEQCGRLFAPIRRTAKYCKEGCSMKAKMARAQARKGES